MSQDEIQRLVQQDHWQRPQRGVYLTGSAPPDWEARCAPHAWGQGDAARHGSNGRPAPRPRRRREARDHRDHRVGDLRSRQCAAMRIHRARKPDAGLITSVTQHPGQHHQPDAARLRLACGPRSLSSGQSARRPSPRPDGRRRAATVPRVRRKGVLGLPPYAPCSISVPKGAQRHTNGFE